MKSEMYNFVLHLALPNLEGAEVGGLRMRAPYGNIVYGPRNYPAHMKPMFEGHQTYPHRPELHPRYSPVFATAGTVVVPPAVALWTSAVVHTGHQKLAPGSEGSRSDNKSWWTSVAQAMTGGFGTGGWQP
jgi:hypothetical protein